MFRISKDSPQYYITSVAYNRLLVFQTKKVKEILCSALDEARSSANVLIFAYVIMPDHLHALVGSEGKPSEVLRYVNGIAGRRVIDFLKTLATSRPSKSLATQRIKGTQIFTLESSPEPSN